jgi:hypothetical protein
MTSVDWVPQRMLGVYTRRSPVGMLIETYHDGYEINGTGVFIWSLIGSDASVFEIARKVTAQYAVEYDDALEAVEEFIGDLLSRGFIQKDESDRQGEH